MKFALLMIFLAAGTAFAAAYTSADFPAPFVTDGTVKSNLTIIVGDRAASSDVLAALDIGMFLQQSAESAQFAFKPKEKLLEGDAVSIGSVSEPLTINKTLGAVRPVFTEVDLDLLKGGSITTQEGSTEYNQYLRLPQGGPAGIIILAETDGIIGVALAWAPSFPLFTWELEFEEGLTSKIEGGKLVDFLDEDVMILGMPFVIVDATYTSSTNRMSISFLGGGLSALLGENDKETFVIDDKEYEVEVLIISETSENGEGSVKFKVNGEITDELEDGETDFLADGTIIAVRDIVPSAKDIQKSIVQFYLGAHIITFVDGNATDDTSNVGSASVNLVKIPKSSSSLMGQDMVINNTFKLKKINYTLYDENLISSSFVFPGKTLRSQQEKPEGFLTPNWDIVNLGFSEAGETHVVLDPALDTSYDLQFTNQEGIFYNIPFMTIDRTNLKFGDDDDDLWFCEPANNSTYHVTDGDFFVLSNCNVATKDNTCLSHVLRYDSIDRTANILTFTDLGTGTRDVVFDNTTREANIVVGGVSYSAFIDPVSPHNISVDLNGDGAVQGNCTYIGIQGEGLLLLGNNNTNDSTIQGPKAFVGGNQSNLTVITLAKEFYDANQDENLTVEIESGIENIGVKSISTVAGGMFGPLQTAHNEDLEWALTQYGLWIDKTDPPEAPETVTIAYPLQQRTGEVYVTSSPFIPHFAGEKSKLASFALPESRLASEITDITQYNAVVVGGPCSNEISSQLLKKPEPCTAPFSTSELVTLFEHPNGNSALMVAGLTAKDTQTAADRIMRVRV